MWGRLLVVAGLVITLAGASGLWGTVLAEGTAVDIMRELIDGMIGDHQRTESTS